MILPLILFSISKEFLNSTHFKQSASYQFTLPAWINMWHLITISHKYKLLHSLFVKLTNLTNRSIIMVINSSQYHQNPNINIQQCHITHSSLRKNTAPECRKTGIEVFCVLKGLGMCSCYMLENNYLCYK